MHKWYTAGSVSPTLTPDPLLGTNRYCYKKTGIRHLLTISPLVVTQYQYIVSRNKIWDTG